MRQGSQVQPTPTAAALPAAVSLLGLLRACAALFKLRIGFAIALSAVGGAVLAAGHWPAIADFAILAASVLLASSGAAGFNHFLERDIDAKMGRTRSRPFASGLFTPTGIWPLGFGALIASGSLMAGWRFGTVCGLFVLAGALTYALVYTVWLKRRTHWNIVIGGAAGSWAVLAGAAAGGDLLGLPVLLLATVLFLWTPSHFWSLSIALAEDYRRAAVPMLPVTRGPEVAARWNLINTLALLAAAVWLAAAVGAPALWFGVLAGGAWLLVATWRMVRNPVPAAAMSAFKASLIQLGALLAGLLAAHVMP